MLDKILNNLDKGYIRNPFLFSLNKALYAKLMFFSEKEPYKLKEQRYLVVRALINTINRAYKQGISPSYRKKIPEILLQNILFRGFKSKIKHKENYGMEPPAFVTISPTNACNLQCIGCYATAENAKKDFKYLPYKTFDKIVEQNKSCFGSYFSVISGGEPFMYNDKKLDKDIFDLFEKHSDTFFLVYTNGTLIDKKNAEKLAKLGNVTPAISVEGFEKETDERRGKGIHKKVLEAMANLREAGVPFGISITPTRKNVEVVFSDEFFRFWFKEQGGLYAWVFQYLAQGRNPDMNLMITPEQRLKSYYDVWDRIKQGNLIADFWNCGGVTRGCMAAGKPRGGYFHILWNGDIELCVFAKIKDKNPILSNVNNLFAHNKTLIDAIMAPVFVAARERHVKFRNEKRNELTPCMTRDNARETGEIVKKTGAIITDSGIEYLIESGELQEYGDDCRKLLDKEWKKLMRN